MSQQQLNSEEKAIQRQVENRTNLSYKDRRVLQARMANVMQRQGGGRLEGATAIPAGVRAQPAANPMLLINAIQQRAAGMAPRGGDPPSMGEGGGMAAVSNALQATLSGGIGQFSWTTTASGIVGCNYSVTGSLGARNFTLLDSGSGTGSESTSASQGSGTTGTTGSGTSNSVGVGVTGSQGQGVGASASVPVPVGEAPVPVNVGVGQSTSVTGGVSASHTTGTSTTATAGQSTGTAGGASAQGNVRRENYRCELYATWTVHSEMTSGFMSFMDHIVNSSSQRQASGETTIGSATFTMNPAST